MADNANGDLQTAQDAVKAMMTPLEDTASSDDAPGEESPVGEYEGAPDYEPTDDSEGAGEGDYEEQPDEAPVYTVKVNGQEVEVTLDELLSGYSRQSDYTRKSQELAERRKSVEVLEQEITAERGQYAELLPAMRRQLEQQMQAEPDWDSLYEKNPIEATKLERQWRKGKEEREAQIRAVAAEQQRLAQVQQQQFDAQVQKQVASEQARLPEMIPEWRNADVAQKEAKEIRGFLISKGFSEQDVSGITHAGIVAMARNAMLFERGKQKVSQAQKGERNKSGPKPMRAGSKGTQPRKRSDVEKAQNRLRQSGRVSDAASVIKNLL
ncbi:MAG: hypothetical protein GY892_19205 [Shimia sp.]|nr:hypothetical protein [Shimia sp.]